MSRACFKVIQEKENLESTSAFARYYIYLLVYALKYNVIIPVIDSFMEESLKCPTKVKNSKKYCTFFA